MTLPPRLFQPLPFATTCNQAEVNLCFDQLVYKLCELTFAQFKEAASVIQLDKTYREELEKMVPASKVKHRWRGAWGTEKRGGGVW